MKNYIRPHFFEIKHWKRELKELFTVVMAVETANLFITYSLSTLSQEYYVS